MDREFDTGLFDVKREIFSKVCKREINAKNSIGNQLKRFLLALPEFLTIYLVITFTLV